MKVPSAVIGLRHPYQYQSLCVTFFLLCDSLSAKDSYESKTDFQKKGATHKSNRTNSFSNRSPDVNTAHNFTSNKPAHVRTINRLPQVGTAHDFCSNESAHVQTINRSPGDSARVRLHESAHVQAISRLSDVETVHRLKCSNSYINQQLTASTSTSSRRSTGGASIQSNTLPLA